MNSSQNSSIDNGHLRQDSFNYNDNELRIIPANRNEIDLYNSLSSTGLTLTQTSNHVDLSQSSNGLTLSQTSNQLNLSQKNGYNLDCQQEYIQYDDGYFESDAGDFDNPIITSKTSTPRSNSTLNSSSHSIPTSLSFKPNYTRTPSQEKIIPEKLKCVILTPNFKHIRNNDIPGIKLCEKMFGIKFCQYNDKVQRVNYNNNVVKDRKIIVQGVVPGSPAETCRLIHRGQFNSHPDMK